MTPRTALVAPALFLSLGSLAQAQTLEGLADCGNNTVQLCYGDHAECSLDAPSDVDLYRFVGKAGDHVRVTMSGLSINIDSSFDVLDPQGNTVASSACSTPANQRCSTSTDFVLTVSGQHTIVAADAGQNEGGNYSLGLVRMPPVIPERFIDYGTPATVNIGFVSDHDFLTFEGSQGDLIRISASGLNINLDSAYTLIAPDGSVVDMGACNTPANQTCSVTSPNLILPMDGTYNLMVHDNGWNEGGNTSVTVTCLVGTCPPNWTQVGTVYCTTNPNSSGNPATIQAWGSEDASLGTLFLYAADTPQDVPGIFFMSPNQVSFPLGSGIRCAGNPAYRFPLIKSCNRSEFRFRPNFANLPQGVQFLPGQTWNFQTWFRDGQMSNTSDGLAVTFQ